MILRVTMLVLSLAFAGGADVRASAVDAQMQQPAGPAWGRLVGSTWDRVVDFYARRGGRPVWTRDGGLSMPAKSALDAIGKADRDGLDPSRYLGPLSGAASKAAADPASFERTMTGAFLHYVADLQFGRLLLEDASPDGRTLRDAAFDPAALLSAIAGAADPDAALRALVPANRPYRALRRARETYRAVAETGGWAAIGKGPTIKPGAADPRLPAIRNRLRATGDLDAAAATGDDIGYDALTVSAVENLQRRYGLEPDGVVGPATLAAMNVPVGERLRQIALNMERWRRFEYDPDGTQIVVNLAGFYLRVIEEGAQVMKMAVAVGRPFRQTPIFSSKMTHLEFSPSWTLPPTILKEDILPQLRRDSTYLAQKGIEVFDGWQAGSTRLLPERIDWQQLGNRALNYRFVQPPGPKNALGTVKFMFPNTHSVYLHDTPDRFVFDRAARALSSGCIRVQKPLDLAKYLLADQSEWTDERIRSAMSQPAPVRVNLLRRPTVRLTYLTVWTESGELHFREDIYGRDRKLRQQLERL